MIFYIYHVKNNNKTLMGSVGAERYELTTFKDNDINIDTIILYKNDEEVARFNGKNIIIEDVECAKTLVNVNIISF